MTPAATREHIGAPAGTTGHDQHDLAHIVGFVQGWLDRLHLAVPRALCGELLIEDPDRPDVKGRTCPVCARRAGWQWCATTGDWVPRRRR